MSGIKRLNIDWTYQEMDPHPEGELVYFDDHAAEIARLRAEADALRVDAERWRFVASASSSVTFRLHNTRPDHRERAIDAAMGAGA